MTLNNLAEDLLDSIHRNISCNFDIDNPEIRMNSFTIEFLCHYFNTLTNNTNIEFDKSKNMSVYGVKVTCDENVKSLQHQMKL